MESHHFARTGAVSEMRFCLRLLLISWLPVPFITIMLIKNLIKFSSTQRIKTEGTEFVYIHFNLINVLDKIFAFCNNGSTLAPLSFFTAVLPSRIIIMRLRL
jgi:hypothetical protein